MIEVNCVLQSKADKTDKEITMTINEQHIVMIIPETNANRCAIQMVTGNTYVVQHSYEQVCAKVQSISGVLVTTMQ